MHNYYSSNRSTIDYNKYPSSNSKYQTGYKYNYPEYNSSRRKTQHDSRDYDNQYLLQRSNIYQQLQEEKLYNQRSRLIIEDLLEENKRKKNLIDDIVINKMNPKQSSSKYNLLQERKYLQDRATRLPPETERTSSPTKNNKTLQSYSREREKDKDRDRDWYEPAHIKKKQSPPTKQSRITNQKDMTKSIILKKLYDEPKKNSPNRKKQNQKQQKINEAQILKDEVQFLKQQLSEKNRDIIELQCQIVRLSKFQKLVAQIIEQKKNKDNNRYHTIQSSAKQQIEQQSESAQSKTRYNVKKQLQFSKRCCQIVIKAKKKQKRPLKKSTCINISIQKSKTIPVLSKSCSLSFSIQRPLPKLLEMCNKTFLTVQKPIRIEKFTNTFRQFKNQQTQTRQDISKSQAQVQTDPQPIRLKNANSKISVHVSQSGVFSSQWGGQMEQNYDIALSSFWQNNVNSTKKKPLQINFLKDQSFIISKNCKEIEFNEGVQVQTEYKCIDQQSQTTQNYYEYIQKTYLQWMFDKQYKQMQAKKKKKIQSQVLS